MKLLLLFLLYSIHLFASSFDTTYKSIEGRWIVPSQDNETDVIISIRSQGRFTLSVVPAFEYTNLSMSEQSNIIAENITQTGYFKFLKTQNNVINTEILLNGEFSTNLMEILSNQIFIINNTNDSKTLFIER